MEDIKQNEEIKNIKYNLLLSKIRKLEKEQEFILAKLNTISKALRR